MVTWASHQPELRYLREQVFVREQNVPADLEWDDLDETATHLLATIDDKPIACARIINYQSIGRMAVSKHWRGMWLGMALLLEAIKICKQQGSKTIVLSAQTHAIGFYRRAGFKVVSDEYLDANIPHVDMQLAFTD
jgi:predicted GNAT family N-acyltransferase